MCNKKIYAYNYFVMVLAHKHTLDSLIRLTFLRQYDIYSLHNVKRVEKANDVSLQHEHPQINVQTRDTEFRHLTGSKNSNIFSSTINYDFYNFLASYLSFLFPFHLRVSLHSPSASSLLFRFSLFSYSLLSFPCTASCAISNAVDERKRDAAISKIANLQPF